MINFQCSVELHMRSAEHAFKYTSFFLVTIYLFKVDKVFKVFMSLQSDCIK